MVRKFLGALATGAALFCCAPANASVVYDLTFFDFSSHQEGTGTLTLNFSTLPQAFNYSNSLAPVLTSITTSDLNGHGTFTITPANLNSGSFLNTGAAGQVFSLTATQAGSGAQSVLFLDLFTNSWQLHNGQAFGCTADQGAFTISAPHLSQGGNASATPLPAALPLFAGGLGAFGYPGWRRKRKVQAAVA